jgi:nucleotide-binding universal stress UspA family protein
MKNILVPTDFNELATAALRTAAWMATATGARITLLYADRFDPPLEFLHVEVLTVAKEIERARQAARDELARYAAAHLPPEVERETVVVEQEPVTAVLAYALDHDFDLIAMGTHGRGGLQRLILGSVAEAVLRESPVPVLTVHATQPRTPIRTIFCDAGALDTASELARTLGARLSAKKAEADLIVVAEEQRDLIRHARVPVLTLINLVPARPPIA